MVLFDNHIYVAVTYVSSIDISFVVVTRHYNEYYWNILANIISR